MHKPETAAASVNYEIERDLRALIKSFEAADDDLDRNGTIPADELRRSIDDVYAEHARETGEVRSTTPRGPRAAGSR